MHETEAYESLTGAPIATRIFMREYNINVVWSGESHTLLPRSTVWICRHSVHQGSTIRCQVEPSANEDIGETLARIEQIKALKNQIDKLKNKQKKEQQFNRRVEINQQIKELGVKVQKLESAK